MTPSLAGRIQTRLALLATIGVAVTGLFALTLHTVAPFVILGGVALLGLGWDVIWDGLQSLRWDRDWPAAFQLASGAAEGAAIFAVVEAGWLPGVDLPDVRIFVAHYGSVFVATFVVAQGPLRVLSPRWRFRGGRLAPGRGPRR